MKILVAYASKHGNTREIAGTLADELSTQSLEADLIQAGEVGDVACYDAVLLGSAIYMGNWLPDAKIFAQVFCDDLARLPVWLFSSGPLGSADPQPRNDPDGLARPLGAVKVRGHRIFAGKLDADDLGFGEHLMARLVGAPQGDFRDWDEIRSWAREIAAELTAYTPVQEEQQHEYSHPQT